MRVALYLGNQNTQWKHLLRQLNERVTNLQTTKATVRNLLFSLKDSSQGT